MFGLFNFLLQVASINIDYRVHFITKDVSVMAANITDGGGAAVFCFVTMH